MKKIAFMTDNLDLETKKLVLSLELYLMESQISISYINFQDVGENSDFNKIVIFVDYATELNYIKKFLKNSNKEPSKNIFCVYLAFQNSVKLNNLKSNSLNENDFENYDNVNESFLFLNSEIPKKTKDFIDENEIPSEFYLNFNKIKKNIFKTQIINKKETALLSFFKFNKINLIRQELKTEDLESVKLKLDKKICLAHLPQWSTQQPPMGIAYLSSYLIKNGFDCCLRDFSIEMYEELGEDFKHLMESSDHELWLNEKVFKNRIWPYLRIFILKWSYQVLSSPVEYLGLTVLTTSRFSTLILASLIKYYNPDVKTILGGPYAARYDGGLKLIKYNYIDFLIPDEGEEVIVELIHALINKTNYTEIKGLIYKVNDEVIDTGQRPLILNLDQLPFPDFSLFPLSYYKSIALPILGSRGCIFSCTFCSETVFWRRFRVRSGQNLFEEFKFHFEKTGQRYYYIVDSLINGNIKELEIFCDLMCGYQEKIEWGGKASIRRQMTPELLLKMKKAGCLHLEYGIESGSPKVLRDMKKGYTLEIGEKVVKDTNAAGIRVGTFWLVGFPTESEIDYQLSKDYLFKLKPYLDHATPGYGAGLLKGSDIQLHPEKYGITQKDGEWYTEHSSPKIRQNRVQDFRKYCAEINVKVH